MIRMILADDEPVIRSGLQKLIDWSSLGIEVSGVYVNGTDAMGAILRELPELALLDISMPGIDGIAILKSIRELSVPTQVIFISGFQDFEYARSAVTFGAVDYLLKPVIKDELLRAIGKALASLQERLPKNEMDEGEIPPAAQKGDGAGTSTEKPAASYKENGNETAREAESRIYVPALAELILPKETGPQEEKLMRFSYFSGLKQYFDEHSEEGVIHREGQDAFLVLKASRNEDIAERLAMIAGRAIGQGKGTPGFVLGRALESIEEMPEAFRGCRDRRQELFFADPGAVLIAGETSDPKAAGPSSSVTAMETLSRARERMAEHLFTGDASVLERDYEQFTRALRSAAEGRKEDACYYFCSTMRYVEDRMQEHHLDGRAPDMKELLEISREAESFHELRDIFYRELLGYRERIRSRMVTEEKRDIIQIWEYIDQHYRENLTLEVMAQQFYMNPYYFSSYFKKQTGSGFKEYLSYIRLQHAISLLMTSGMKTYEIAAEVGFADARAFTDAFTKRYGETPSSYRKRLRTE